MPTDLTLRRKVLEAMGWKHASNCGHCEEHADAFTVYPARQYPCVMLDPQGVCGPEPAIESDPTCSEPLFLEFCEKRGLEAEMIINGGGKGPTRIELRNQHGTAAKVYGATPSEARAKAILAAVEREGK